jgi:ADP-heptose:LPS heptosyltransferase
MGDVAMTVPVIRALVQQHPTVQITFLSKPFLKPLFENMDNVSFYAAQVKGKHKGFYGLYKLYRELRALPITEVADLHNVLRSKILGFFFRISGIKVAIINKGRAEKKALTRIKNKIFKPLKTTHQRYIDVFEKLGIGVDISNPKFPTSNPLTEPIKKITGEKKESWIGIAPFAQHQPKMYPLDLMEQVIDALSKEKKYRIILFGGGLSEIETLKKMASDYPNTINAAGNLKLGQELQLISHLDCMLSMDSGNGHFAAMQGINTITVWGATHPYTGFAPFNQPFDNALLPDLKKFPNVPTSIYGNRKISGYENVMRSISPESIIRKIKSGL